MCPGAVSDSISAEFNPALWDKSIRLLEETMKRIALAIIALALVLVNGCASNGLPGPKSVTHSARQNDASLYFSSPGSPRSPASQTILENAALAFRKLKSLRIIERLEPVSGSYASYEIEIAAPDRERFVSRGDCPYNGRGEKITLGSTVFSRCGNTPWQESKQTGILSLDAYLDYMQNGSAFAIASHDSNNLWEITADYHGVQAPPGAMTWFIGQDNFLPHKLLFTNLGGYALTSEFRDFDDPSIVIEVPIADEGHEEKFQSR
jgi:hypothetical protein